MRDGRFGIGVIAALVVCALLLAVAGPRLFKKKPQTQPTSSGAAAARVITAKGIVESEEEVDLGSQIAGVITTVNVAEGEKVRKGELLVVFKNDSVDARVKQAEGEVARARARLSELEAGFRAEDKKAAKGAVDRAAAVYKQTKDEFERQKRLYSVEAATLIDLQRAEEKFKVAEGDLNSVQATYDKMRSGARAEEITQAKAMVQSALSELAFAQSRLDDYYIRSPIDGIVAKRLRDSGESVEEGTVVLKVINPERVRVRAELEESDVGKVTQGQAAEVVTDAYSDRVFRGKVVKILPVVQRKSQKTFDPMASLDINTQEIHVNLDDSSGLKNGMSVTVRFIK